MISLAIEHDQINKRGRVVTAPCGAPPTTHAANVPLARRGYHTPSGAGGAPGRYSAQCPSRTRAGALTGCRPGAPRRGAPHECRPKPRVRQYQRRPVVVGFAADNLAVVVQEIEVERAVRTGDVPLAPERFLDGEEARHERDGGER